MAIPIFPIEIVENTAEANFATHSVRTRLIYCSVLLFFLCTLAILPFIKTDVSIRARGTIRPVTDRNPVSALVSGYIANLYIDENTYVKRGEPIARISSPQLEEKLAFNRWRRKKAHQFVSDLQKLTALDSVSVFKSMVLQTSKYQSTLLQLRQHMHTYRQIVLQEQRNFERDQKLYHRKVISKARYEQSAFKLRKARHDFHVQLNQQLSKWQVELVSYQSELEQLESESEQLVKQQNRYLIVAPVSGTIQNMKGIYEGSPVVANEILAEISPDTSLIAECYVLPKDIGLITNGMEGYFQITAYDYNEWGFLKGKIVSISDDITLINNRPMFTVRASLDQPFLALNNGYRSYLKKGMALQARFVLTRRSLLQLLHDKVDDWLNPKWINQQPEVASLSGNPI